MLTSEDSGFYIHVDLKSDIGEFSGISGDNIFFSEQRIPVYWAEYSNVEAISQSIRQALSSCQRYDYFVLMQGSDYPLRSGAYIERFLNENNGAEFISMTKMPAPGYPLSKINTLRYTSDKPIRRFVARGLAKFGFAQRDYRNYLGDLEPYAGDACWALSRAACEYLLEFADLNPHVGEYFRNTHAVDESFFHTILGNSKFRVCARRSLLYRDWPVAGHHPAMLRDEHVARFEKRDKVFIDDQFGRGEVLLARKFSDENLALIDRMDAMIEQKDRAGICA